MLPAPLPFTVKPRPGEHYTSYIRRLAQANHLRPSLLRAYVNTDAHSVRPLHLDRLAAVSGRPAQALRKALTGLPAPHPATRFKKQYPKRKLATTPEERCTQDWQLAQDEVRYHDELALFAAIRADAQTVGMTVTKLARNHFVGSELVRYVLRGREPRPVSLARRDKPALVLGPVKGPIKQMWDQGMTCDQIWSEVVDKHHAAVSKTTVKLYLRALRHGAG